MTEDPALQLCEGSLFFFFLSLILRQISAGFGSFWCGEPSSALSCCLTRPSTGVKGSRVCVETHVSPQQMAVSVAILSHQPERLPGLGLLQPSQQATGFTSTC